MKPCSLLGKAVWVLRARPKSHTLRSQLALSSRLEGLRSRWMTLSTVPNGKLTLGGVEGLQRTTRLVNKVLAMVVAKILGADDAVEVRLEQLLDEVY